MSGKKGIAKSLSEEQIKFWLANTKLTREQLVEWYNSFLDFSEKNEKLDKANFVKFFEKLQHSNKNSEGFYNYIFNAFDKDNSGFIDFHEFIVGFNIVGQGDLNARLEWMFDVYDQNRDKSIDRKEIENILRAILKMGKKQLAGNQTTDQKIDELFDKLDDNENEKISKEEFVSNCANNVFLRDILCPSL